MYTHVSCLVTMARISMPTAWSRSHVPLVEAGDGSSHAISDSLAHVSRQNARAFSSDA